MVLRFEENGKILIARILENKLSNNHHGEFRDSIEMKINNGNLLIGIDFSLVHYMGSPGVGVLITLRDEMNIASEKLNRPAKLALFGLNSSVHNLLTLLKIDTFFKIYNNESDAIKYLSE